MLSVWRGYWVRINCNFEADLRMPTDSWEELVYVSKQSAVHVNELVYTIG